MIAKTADSLVCPFQSIKFSPLGFLPLCMKCTKFLPNRAAVFARPLAPPPFIFTIEGSVCTDTEIVGIWWLWWWLFVPNAELKIKGQVYHVYGYLLKSLPNKITRLWKCDVRRSENVGAENCTWKIGCRRVKCTTTLFPSISFYFHIPKNFLNFFPHTRKNRNRRKSNLLP